jgi:hypothetical protein
MERFSHEINSRKEKKGPYKAIARPPPAPSPPTYVPWDTAPFPRQGGTRESRVWRNVVPIIRLENPSGFKSTPSI